MAPDDKNTKISNFTPTVALGVAAHPDDLDFTAAGSVAAWTAAGAEVYYLVLTNGNKGSKDPATDQRALVETRRLEQREAAKLLGVKDVIFCEYDDGELTVSKNVKRDITRVIRQVRPDTVFTLDPSMVYAPRHGFINHPDHRAAGQAALDAVYPLARDPLMFPELLHEEHLEPHNVATVLLTNFSMDCDKHSCVIDITATIEQKLLALAAHPSQFTDMAATQNRVRTIAADEGARCGVDYAEGFIRIDVA